MIKRPPQKENCSIRWDGGVTQGNKEHYLLRRFEETRAGMHTVTDRGIARGRSRSSLGQGRARDDALESETVDNVRHGSVRHGTKSISDNRPDGGLDFN